MEKTTILYYHIPFFDSLGLLIKYMYKEIMKRTYNVYLVHSQRLVTAQL